MTRFFRGLAAALVLLVGLQLQVGATPAGPELRPAVAQAQLVSGVPAVAVLGRGWTPSRLFVGGQLGAWYDVSDLSTMFQDSAGTTPAVVDSPVGLIRDKSGYGYNLTQSTGANRPILRQSGATYYLEFDGSNDALAASGTGLDLFKNVSAGALFAGLAVANTSLAQPGMFGWSINSSNATRLAILPNSAALQAGGRRLDADSFAAANAAAVLSANTPFVASALFDFANTRATLRKDRAQVAQNTSFQAAGSTSNTSSSTGGVSTTSGVYAGRFYGGIALARIPDDATIALIEAYYVRKTGT